MKRIAIFEDELKASIIDRMSGDYGDNEFFIKRDDLIPFSFGGCKVRKAREYYKDIVQKDADVIMTYGSRGSNHCRVISNMACLMGIDCHIISPRSNFKPHFGSKLQESFGALTEVCPLDKVAETIDNRKDAFIKEGRKPYFIMGGGNGPIGTGAYVKAYSEILLYEKEKGISFDYIFLASGTSGTQAGLICGRILNREGTEDDHRIVGISIARDKERGTEAVRESVEACLGPDKSGLVRDDDIIFTDSYLGEGYGQYDPRVDETIDKVMKEDGIPLDATYTGKAFMGMTRYLKKAGISGKRILFIHTGGTPLYFDHLSE